MVRGIGRTSLIAGLAAASLAGAVSLGSTELPPAKISQPPREQRKAPGVKRPPGRKKPLKAELTRRERLRMPARGSRGKGRVARGNITTIRQAMRAGGVKIKVKNPEKYLHSSARAAAGLKA